MNPKIKLMPSKSFGKISLEQLHQDYREILEDGDGYILVYKNKKDKSYYIMSNGFTNEEGVYSSQLICNGIINENSQFKTKDKSPSD